ncbi:YhdP family protein [Teichococcus aestuarii]|uniref:DUF3971 domain-containing protein n=1 Tax=Teichococcus aestuarii TaxID=568898 RepID=A0A2U1VA80_9PROT|nr:DUF3971 domain-containing protein [Pseudoroseomonas aestuarii]PWC30827.1 DUF3971 domain-containing protein [Pseudoroseomonas aestuarii]
MRRLSGQALRCCGWLGGWLGRTLLALLLVSGLGLAALSWRLSQGPLHLPVLASVLEDMAPRLGLEEALEVEDVAIAWSGFRQADRSPLELRISGVRLRDAAGAVRQELPDATVTLAFGELLRGTVMPLRIAVQKPNVVLERAADGSVTLALGRTPPQPSPEAPATPSAEGGDVLRGLIGPEAEDTPLGALRRLDLADGRLTILDRQLNLVWRLEAVNLALRRLPGGGAEGEGSAALRLPDHGAPLPVRLAGRVEGALERLEGSLSLPALEPARIARLMPALAPLALFDAPASLEISGRLDGRQAGALPQLDLKLEAGPGGIVHAGRRIAFAGLSLAAEGNPAALELRRLRLALPAVARENGTATPAPPVIEASGQARLEGGRWRAGLDLSLATLAAADLGAYWPEGVVPGARKWVVENVTGGAFQGGRFALAAEAAADLSGLRVTALDGTLGLEQGVVHWLRPIPPLEGVAATARFGLKEIRIEAATARQSGTALNSPGAVIRFHGLDGSQEQAEIEAKLRGPVPEVVALIRHPRLKLFEKRPLDLKEPGGQMEGTLRLAFPLLEDIPSEVLRVQVQARLTQLRLADVVLGKRLERGTAELSVTNSTLKASGNAQLDGIPTQLSVEMDFRPGPATQVVERIRAEARPDAARIADFGLDLEGFVAGPVGVQAVMEKRRAGDMRVSINGDLRESRMTLTPFAWSKPPGQPATAQAELRVEGESLRAVESFRVTAPSLSARGRVGFAAASRPERVDVAEAAIFAGRFAAQAWPPARPGTPWRFRLEGPVLDLGPALAAQDAAGGDAAGGDGPPVAVEGRFDQVRLGEGRVLAGVAGRALADARGVLREARFTGQTGPGGGFDVAVTPDGAGRALRLHAENAGDLLRAFDVLRTVQGGRLAVTGRWPGNAPGATLGGTAEMENFSVSEAEGIGKLLQALTVYGVFDAVRGPGLSFSRMVAPFRLTPETLFVQEARAFSASLGVTAKGSIPRHGGAIDLEGTIVPAYVLNSLLGQIPLLGRLFSPEQGGGLFAATWRMRGPVQDPAVSVNPLAALTPGFLRGLFGGGAAPGQQPAPPAER